MAKIILSTEQILSLKALHKNIQSGKIRDRIKAILLLDKGFTYEEIREILLISDSSIRRYEDIFITLGIESLIETEYKGGIPKLNPEQEKELCDHLENNLYGSSKEIVEYIKNKYRIEYTPDGLVITLHRLGFSYKKPKKLPAKADIKEQEAFIKGYKELRDSLNEEKETMYFLDGVHPTHNVMPAYAWIKKGEDKYIKSNTGRKRININGAFCPIDNSIVVRDDERINSESTINLLKSLEAKHPELDKIYAICDNVRYYYSKAVWEYLKESKIELIYLPPYSPNLNLIERLWKFFKKKVIYNKYYERYEMFKYTVMQFFENIEVYENELKSLMSENFQLFDSI
jgi:transposase